jgi:predicted kinase
MPTLHIICGLPGSGKSTLALKLEKELPAIRFTPDEWMLRLVGNIYDEAARASVEAIPTELAFKLLGLGVDAILENGFWSRSERDAIRNRAQSSGADVQLYFMNAQPSTLRARILARNAHAPSGFQIPPEDLDLWVGDFEAPTSDEQPIIVAQ